MKGSDVVLTWTSGASYDSIIIERDGQAIATLSGSATTYADSPPSGEHGYRVRAKIAGRQSAAPFAFASVWSLAEPAMVAVELETPSSLKLKWANQAAYDSIQIFHNGELCAELPGDSTSFTDADFRASVALYHVRGLSGAGRTRRIAAVYGTKPAFGEQGVENLTCRYTEPGTVALSWDPVTAAESYEIARKGEGQPIVLGTLPGSAGEFIDHPAFDRRTLRYNVDTVIGGVPVARRVCSIPHVYDTIRHLKATFSVETGITEFHWENAAEYIAIVVSLDGVQVASLPGDATSFAHQVTFGGASQIVTFAFHPFGSTFSTDPVEVKLADPSDLKPFLRGDANWDGTVSIADALYIRRYLFGGQAAPICFDAADANDDGRLDIADQVTIVYATLLAGVIFPEPYPLPGLDLTFDYMDCEGGDIIPGVFTEDVLRIGEVEAAPGQEVMVPVFISNLIPVEAFQLVIRFDPELFTPVEGGLDFAGTAYDILYGVEVRPPDFSSLHVPEGDDHILVGAMWSFTLDKPVLPGEDQLLVRIRGLVSSDAVPGETIELEPDNGPNGEGVGIHRFRNEITSHGESRYVAFYPKTVIGFVKIKDNPTTMDYLRSDSNGDGSLNIADAVFTLMYLFCHGQVPACPDAADANDNGKLDIGDSIMTLDYLFGSGSTVQVPPGFGRCAIDTTADTLGTCHYEHCR